MSLPFPNRIGLLTQMSVSVGGGINKILRWPCNISRMNPCEKLIVEHMYNKKCIAIEIGLEKFNLTRFVFLQKHFLKKNTDIKRWKYNSSLLLEILFFYASLVNSSRLQMSSDTWWSFPFPNKIGLLVQMLVSVGGINKILA